MTPDLRARFDPALDAALRSLQYPGLSFKPAKRKLRILLEARPVAELAFVDLARTDGVYLQARVFDGSTCQTLKALDLPPLNIVLSQDLLLLSSLSEENKEFGDQLGGAVNLYAAMDVEAISAKIVEKLKAFHLPVIHRFLTLAPQLPDDILQYPAHYAFPAATAALAIRANGQGEEAFAEFARKAKAEKFWGLSQESITVAQERVAQLG